MNKFKSTAEFLLGLLCLAILTAFFLTFFYSDFVLAGAGFEDRDRAFAAKWYERPDPDGDIITFTFYDGPPIISETEPVREIIPQSAPAALHSADNPSGPEPSADFPFRPEAPPPPVKHDAGSLYNAGFDYYNSGDYQNAADYFTAVINNYSGSSYYEGSLYHLAKSYSAMNKPAEAAATFEKMITLLESSRSRPDWFFDLAEIHLEQMHFENAAKRFETFEREYPDHPRAPEALYRAGLAYEKAFDKASAANVFRATVSKYRFSPFAETAAKRLEVLNY